MRCVLHIGTEKTGTKTVQRFLVQNRQRLARRRILVPVATFLGNAIGLPVMAYDPERADDLTGHLAISTEAELLQFQRRIKASLASELQRRKPSAAVFSSEHLQSRLTKPEEIQRLRESLTSMGFEEFTVAVYLRRPADLANSLFSTALRAAHDMRDLPTPEHDYVRVVCDHRATIVRWMSVFGQEAVCPRLFVSGEFVNGSLVDDFAAVSAISMEGLGRPASVNTALSEPAAELLRRVNGIIAERSPFAPVPPVDDIVKAVDGVVGRHMPYSMPSSLRGRYDAAFAESDEWVRQRFFSSRDTLWPVRAADDRESAASDGVGLDRSAARVAELCIRHGWCRPRAEGQPPARLSPWRRGIGRMHRAWRRRTLRRLLRQEAGVLSTAAGNATGRGGGE